jgi:hypothetical protein
MKICLNNGGFAMKKVLLILSLAAGNLALASDVTHVMRVGDKLIELPSTPMTLDDYILAVSSRLPQAIESTRIFEDLSDHALRRNGGWGHYLSLLLNEDRNITRLSGSNAERVHSRILLYKLLKSIDRGLKSGGIQNVAVVEYLLSALVNNHTYSYPEVLNRPFDEGKRAILRARIKVYLDNLNYAEGLRLPKRHLRA